MINSKNKIHQGGGIIEKIVLRKVFFLNFVVCFQLA